MSEKITFLVYFLQHFTSKILINLNNKLHKFIYYHQ